MEELRRIALELLDKYESAEEGIIYMRGTPNKELPVLESEILEYRAKIEAIGREDGLRCGVCGDLPLVGGVCRGCGNLLRG